MLWVRAVIALCAALAVAAPMAHADDPFYAGKRLTILINFAAGGPTDIEGRLCQAPRPPRRRDAQYRHPEHGRRRRHCRG